MARTDEEIHRECMQRFIDLANQIKEEGMAPRLVSAGMTTATAVYATYVFAGNDGRLAPAGIEKLTASFREQLEHVQQAKAEQQQSIS
jgi:hypothetical protein